MYPSCTDPQEHIFKRNVIMNELMTHIFDSTCKLYKMKIQIKHYYDEFDSLKKIMKETKTRLTNLVRAVLETDPNYYNNYLGPHY